MNNVTPNLWRFHVLPAGIILILLSACDGGIFGTGDSTTIDATGPISNEGPPGATPDNSMTPEAPGSNETDPADTSSQSMFQNLLTGGDNNQPLITVVNASSNRINATVADQSTPLFDTPVTTGSISNTVTLSTDTRALQIFSTEPSSTSVTFEPLDLAASSITTFIARDSVSLMSTTELGVIALRTLRIAPDETVAHVRVIQANMLGNIDRATTFTLVPQGVNPGSNEVQFTDVSASITPSDDYTSVNAGTYVLTDTLARFTPVPITVIAGEMYTIILIDTVSPVAVLQNDSAAAGQ